MTYLFIAIGGALGAVLRYLVTLGFAFPLGTLCVNVIGSFLMGMVFVWVSSKAAGNAQLFLMTGVLGGFTTFSAFSLDVLKMIEGGRWAYVSQYVLASVILSIAAVFVGAYIMKAVST